MSTDIIPVREGTVLLVEESAFGSVSGTALTPSTSVFASGGISPPFDMVAVPKIDVETVARTEMRARRGRKAPHVVGPYVSNSKVGRRSGDIQLTMSYRGIGSGVSDDYALHLLLASMLSDGGEPSPTSDAVLAFHDPAPGSTAANAFYFRPTTVASFEEGQVISADVDGRPCPLYVVAVDDTESAEWVKVLGAPRHLTDGDTIRFTRQFKNATAGPSFAMRIDKPKPAGGSQGYRAECFGCRVTGLTGTFTPTGDSAVLSLTFTIRVAHLRYDHANAATTPVAYPDGVEAQMIGSDIAVSATLPAEGTAGPYEAARVADIYAGMFSFGLQAIPGEAPDGRTVVAGEYIIADVEASADVRLTRPQLGFDRELEDQVPRYVGIAAGSVGAGNALLLVFPVAEATADGAGRGEEGEVLVQDLGFMDGTPRGTATASSADSSFILAVVH